MPLEIVRNDITKMQVDAIVNAANPSLLGGGGVDGAIHRAAGPELQAECATLGGCNPGEAKATKGYRLPAKYVIHTVGPVWHGGRFGEAALLAACYRNCLNTALALSCESVAFPMISTGAYGFPKEKALPIAMEEISRFLMDHDMQVYLVVFGRDSLSVSQKLFGSIQEYIDQHYVDEHFKEIPENRRRYLWRRDKESAMDYDTALPQIAFPATSIGDAAPHPDWTALLKQTDEGFPAMLLRKIDERGMTDAQCYKKANVDRKLFSKIRANPDYRPRKTTVLAFAAALELPLEEAKEMLGKAGFALTHSSKADIILEYCFLHGIYNVMEINEILFSFDLPLLGAAKE